MSGLLCLNGTWDLLYAEGPPLVHPLHLMGPTLVGRAALKAPVPAPVHDVLLRAGRIDDPNVGLNSLRARWVEEMFWVYRHRFAVPDQAVEQRAWLVFHRLEHEATVWLNGDQIGCHANAHRPAQFDVTGRLVPGENLLVVELSTGMHSAADKPGAEYACAGADLLTKRPWHRKPQYQCGWDWSARLMNVGILGNVHLEWRHAARLGQVAVFAVPSETLSRATFFVRAEVESFGEGQRAVLSTRIVETGQTERKEIDLTPGTSRHELQLNVEQPQLWWPVGQGPQALYTVEVEFACEGDLERIVRQTGVRRVAFNQDPHPVAGRYCVLEINNRPIFCKGGNWVPPDLLYSTVDGERYRALVRLAIEANFNLLRIWGGGLYADHALCEACDRAGILLWHDFPFACAKYPGDDPAFAEEVRREVRWAVRELAHHPSLVVWCGNNEIEWGDWEWGYDRQPRTHPHYALFHRDIPRIVQQENPSTPHWLSSPWSPDFLPPNDPTAGDQHPWGATLRVAGGVDWWKFRDRADRFPNEGGVLGASSPATLRQFLPEGERALLSPSWEHHDNPFAVMGAQPGALGPAYATVQLWTGLDPLALPWEKYAFLSALLQAEGLVEYIANYRRRMWSSASAIFWMYNDSWPVTHGWTIVDYYRRRKLAYHPVRRAFAPVTVVTVWENDTVILFGINDMPEPWGGSLRYGLFSLAGTYPVDERCAVVLPPGASTPLARISGAHWDALGIANGGAFGLLEQDGMVVAQHRLFRARFGELRFANPDVDLHWDGETLTLRADVFVWGVCLDVDGDLPLPDNCFDLLPGVAHILPWPSTLGRPTIVRIGSRDAVPPDVNPLCR